MLANPESGPHSNIHKIRHSRAMAELFLLVEINKIKAWGAYQVYPTGDIQDIFERLKRQSEPERFLVLQTNSDFEYLFFDGAYWVENYEPSDDDYDDA